MSLWVRVLQLLARWGCPILCCLGLLSLSIFDHVPWYACAIIICAFLLCYWAWASTFASLVWTVCFARQEAAKKEFFESLLDGDELQLNENMGMQRHFKAKSTLFSISVRQGIPLVIGFVVIFGLSWFFSSGCLALEPLSMSFRGMRSLSQEPCDAGLKPCMVYLNVADNSSSTMFVVFHTNYKLTSPNIKLATESKPTPLDYEITVPAEYIEMNLEVPRFVYVAYLSHLEAKQTYYFVAGDGQVIESYAAERKFRTTDSSLQHRQLKIVSGGDVGITTVTKTLLSLAASHDPDMIFIGGDLAYGNGIRTCYRRWDNWLKLYSTMAITPKGESIPLLTAIGNHEAGGFKLTASHAPFYLNYFFHQAFNTVPQASSPSYSSKSPATKYRPSNIPPNTYHAHDMAGNLVVVLDSDVISPSGGEQRQFLQDTLNRSKYGRYPSTWKFALYHTPLYPSVRNFNNPASKKLRNEWEPLFSEYHVDVAFENHDHSYKRSHPILNGNVVPTGHGGTVYLGDGAFGVTPRKPAPIHQRDYLVDAQSESFFFAVTLTARNVSIQAINPRNVIFDSHIIVKP